MQTAPLQVRRGIGSGLATAVRPQHVVRNSCTSVGRLFLPPMPCFFHHFFYLFFFHSSIVNVRKYCSMYTAVEVANLVYGSETIFSFTRKTTWNGGHVLSTTDGSAYPSHKTLFPHQNSTKRDYFPTPPSSARCWRLYSRVRRGETEAFSFQKSVRQGCVEIENVAYVSIRCSGTPAAPVRLFCSSRCPNTRYVRLHCCHCDLL